MANFTEIVKLYLNNAKARAEDYSEKMAGPNTAHALEFWAANARKEALGLDDKGPLGVAGLYVSLFSAANNSSISAEAQSHLNAAKKSVQETFQKLRAANSIPSVLSHEEAIVKIVQRFADKDWQKNLTPEQIAVIHTDASASEISDARMLKKSTYRERQSARNYHNFWQEKQKALLESYSIPDYTGQDPDIRRSDTVNLFGGVKMEVPIDFEKVNDQFKAIQVNSKNGQISYRDRLGRYTVANGKDTKMDPEKSKNLVVAMIPYLRSALVARYHALGIKVWTGTLLRAINSLSENDVDIKLDAKGGPRLSVTLPEMTRNARSSEKTGPVSVRMYGPIVFGGRGVVFAHNQSGMLKFPLSPGAGGKGANWKRVSMVGPAAARNIFDDDLVVEALNATRSHNLQPTKKGVQQEMAAVKPLATVVLESFTEIIK